MFLRGFLNQVHEIFGLPEQVPGIGTLPDDQRISMAHGTTPPDHGAEGFDPFLGRVRVREREFLPDRTLG